MAVKVRTETIADSAIDIYVNDAGRFEATLGEQSYSGVTLDELRDKVTRAAKRLREVEAVPVSVLNMIPKSATAPRMYDDGPFVDGIGVVHAMLRGKHERNSDWLLASGETGKGPKFKLGAYRQAANIVRRLTDEEVAQYEQLANAVANAEANLEAFRASVALDPEKALGMEDGTKKRGSARV